MTRDKKLEKWIIENYVRIMIEYHREIQKELHESMFIGPKFPPVEVSDPRLPEAYRK